MQLFKIQYKYLRKKKSKEMVEFAGEVFCRCTVTINLLALRYQSS